MAECVVVVPLWRGVEGIVRMADSLARTTGDRAYPLFVVSHDDQGTRDALALSPLSMLGDVLVVPGEGGGGGDYARKINAGLRATAEPLVFTGARDIEFCEGWYEAASALLSEWRESTQRFGDGATLTGPFQLARPDAIGVVGTVDLCNPRTGSGEHSTHSLVARWWAAPGLAVFDAVEPSIYCEGYDHEYVDDELVLRARTYGSYAHAFDAVVQHHHWLLDPTLDDETYQRGRARSRLSRRLFMQRRRRILGGAATTRRR